MPDSRSSTNVFQGGGSADRQVIALQNALSRIAAQNNDPGLKRLISDAAVQCKVLRQLFDGHHPKGGLQEHPVDLHVFDKLMALAGPVTAVELLDQLLLDLRSVADRLARTPDWGTMRSQCHILIAVAGAVGARSVQGYAERLYDAANRTDATGATEVTPGLMTQLTALIAFVKAERSARTAT